MYSTNAAYKKIRDVADAANIHTAMDDNHNFGLHPAPHGFYTCPNCGKANAHIKDDQPASAQYRHMLHCFSCGKTYDAVDLYKGYYGCSSTEAAQALSDQQHLGIAFNLVASPHKPQVPANTTPSANTNQAPRRSPPEIDRIYHVLQQLLPPGPELRQRLKTERDLTDAEIDRYIIAPIPPNFSNRLFTALQTEGIVASDMFGVPGIYRQEDGSPGVRYYPNSEFGIIAYDTDGLRRGIQIRKKPGDAFRYLWLSSKSQEFGCPSGTPFNFLPAAGTRTFMPLAITEGFFKGIALAHLGLRTLALPSVNCTRGIDKLVETQRVKTMILAFDMDKSEKQEVAKCTYELATRLHNAGLKVHIAEWDAKYKGIDDCIHAKQQKSLCTIQYGDYNWDALFSQTNKSSQ